MALNQIAIIVTIVTAIIFVFIGVTRVRGFRVNLEDYIVHRDSLTVVPALTTVTASVAGAWILFSPGETASWAGIAGLSGYAIGQAAPLFAFGLLGPRMRQLMPQGHSFTEFVWFRYGTSMHLLSLAIMLFYMFIFLSAELTGISLALSLIAKVPLGLTAFIVATATVAYTSYGGIRASIATDQFQFHIIFPLLFIAFLTVIITLGGIPESFSPIQDATPDLMKFTYLPGIKFGVTLIIAICAANMFHQGFWQRVYACVNDQTVFRAFSMSGILVMPLVLLAGLFGMIAIAHGLAVEDSSIALFWLILEIFPSWATMLVLVLALALVMSSMDTLLNGIVSSLTSAIPRFLPTPNVHSLLRFSRLITVVFAIPAIVIASQGQSVLYLFLVADLVCAGSVFPVFYGLYSSRISGRVAFTSSVLGIALGSLFFPGPNFAPWINIPFAGDFLVSFSTALLASTSLSVMWANLGPSDSSTKFDFGKLRDKVLLISQ